jgi:hypothetical protein
VVALLSTISQSKRLAWIAYLLLFFGIERCRPTFWMFRFAWRGAISTRRRRGRWVYITTGVDGRREEGAGRTRVMRDECTRVLGYSGNYCYFCQFVNQHPLPRNHLYLRLAYRERRNQTRSVRRRCWNADCRRNVRIANADCLVLDVIWRLSLIEISFELAAFSLAYRRYKGMSHNWCFRCAAVIRWPQLRPRSSNCALRLLKSNTELWFCR